MQRRAVAECAAGRVPKATHADRGARCIGNRVEVVDLREGTFYAEISLVQQNGTPTRVDARPSDAIAMATAMGKPVFVAEDVLRDASIM